MGFISPWLIIFGLVGLMGGGAYLYYKDTQSTIRQLQENNATLEIVQEENIETINMLKSSLRLAEENSKEQRERAIKAEEYQDALAEQLRRHDLTVLSIKKPGMIEKRVNDATKQIIQQIESESISDF